jgi:hypothetical protein
MSLSIAEAILEAAQTLRRGDVEEARREAGSCSQRCWKGSRVSDPARRKQISLRILAASPRVDYEKGSR